MLKQGNLSRQFIGDFIMEENGLNQQIAEINRKLDLLTENMAVQQRRQREFMELKDDLSRIGTDLFQTAVVELEDVSPYFDTDDFLHLMKKLMRNTRALTKMIDQLENASDFIRDALPLQKDVFLNLLHTLDDLDRKGYFVFMEEGVRMMDNIVTSFSPEDARSLADNIVHILSTIRNLTQPEMMAAMNNALMVYKNIDFEVKDEVSIMGLIKEMRSPEARRGMAIGLQFLKNLSNLDTQSTGA